MQNLTSSFASAASAVLCAATFAVVTLPAQNKQTIVPKDFATAGTSRTLVPLSEQPMHYQQTIQGAKLVEQIASPVRFRGIAFRTKTGAMTGVQIEVQVAIATFAGGRLNGIFSRNMGGDASVVVPRQKVNLPTSTGGFDLSLPFTKDWVWDGKSDIVLDIRMYSNGNNNRQFFYWWDSIAPRSGTGVNAHYALGANATTALVPLASQGLVVRLEYQDGVVLNYGAGCKGQGGFIPKISSLGLPSVGNQGFRINVSNARPNTGAILLWGSSDSKWGPVNLPFSTVGIGIPNCQILAEPLALLGTNTIGGSPGTGIGSVPLAIPPSGIFIGYNLYMQWAVVDDSNTAALDLVFSDAMRVVIGG